jgi:hypothetical protein
VIRWYSVSLEPSGRSWLIFGSALAAIHHGGSPRLIQRYYLCDSSAPGMAILWE